MDDYPALFTAPKRHLSIAPIVAIVAVVIVLVLA